MAGAAPPGLRVSRGGPHPGYRPCVGLMLINPAGLLFIGQRRGPALDAWQMPQGGIDPDETPREAAWRELREEVGTDRAQLVAESRCWYAYDLPPELWPPRWGGQYRGQSQKWFAFRFTGTDEDIDIAAHEPEFVRWRWAGARRGVAPGRRVQAPGLPSGPRRVRLSAGGLSAGALRSAEPCAGRPACQPWVTSLDAERPSAHAPVRSGAAVSRGTERGLA